MIKIGDYEKIMSDRDIFSQIVYTPLSEATQLLEERRKDPELMAKVEKLLSGDIPECFKKDKKCAVLFRQIATPNHETKRFIALAKKNNLHPAIWEYHDDKFISVNEFKRSLGQLHIQKKSSKNGSYNFEKITVIDFNLHNGKKLKDIKTLWSESLIDFHKKLFTVHNYHADDFHLYNASNWFKKNGGKAVDYYINFFLLFSCFGILFENFLRLKNSEGDFTKNTVLPAIEKVMNLAGVKPLIVPLEPLDLETDNRWYHHSPEVRVMIPTHKYDK